MPAGRGVGQGEYGGRSGAGALLGGEREAAGDDLLGAMMIEGDAAALDFDDDGAVVAQEVDVDAGEEAEVQEALAEFGVAEDVGDFDVFARQADGEGAGGRDFGSAGGAEAADNEVVNEGLEADVAAGLELAGFDGLGDEFGDGAAAQADEVVVVFAQVGVFVDVDGTQSEAAGDAQVAEQPHDAADARGVEGRGTQVGELAEVIDREVAVVVHEGVDDGAVVGGQVLLEVLQDGGELALEEGVLAVGDGGHGASGGRGVNPSPATVGVAATGASWRLKFDGMGEAG